MNEKTGIMIAFCTTLTWSIGIFPFTEASRRLGANSVNHFRLLLAVSFLTIISFTLLPLSLSEFFSSPMPEHWLWFGLSGVIGLALGDYFSFTSFAILGTRLGSIFSTLSPTATLMTGFFLVGERINLVGILGIVLTIAGMIWLSLSRSETAGIKDVGHGSLKTGIFFGVLSALCQGIGVVLANKGFIYHTTSALREGLEVVIANKGFTYHSTNTTLPFLQATWLRMISATVVIHLFTLFFGNMKKVYEPVLENRKKGNMFALAGTIFGPVIGVSLSMYTISLLKDKPSVAQTIFSLVPIFALPLAIIFYREKVTLKSLLGAVVAVLGVIILIQRDHISNTLFGH